MSASPSAPGRTSSEARERLASRVSPRTDAAPAPTALDLRPVEGTAADAELAILAKAIGNPVRVHILRMLARRQGWICGDIVLEFQLAQSTISQHLKVLKAAGLIRGDSEGTHVCYQIEPSALRRLKALVAGL